jgi:hypothetical protein
MSCLHAVHDLDQVMVARGNIFGVAETQGLMGGYLELKGIKAEGRSVVGDPFLLPFAELVELDFDHLQVFVM